MPADSRSPGGITFGCSFRQQAAHNPSGARSIKAPSASKGMRRTHPQRPHVFNVPYGLRGFYELVDLPPGLEPVDVAGEGPFMHFA